MKKEKGISLIVSVTYIALMLYMQAKNQEVFNLLGCAIGLLFLFSLLVRKDIRFKGYFTSKYNVFNAKIRYTKEFDLPKDILFHKIEEVLKEAGFKVVNTNKTESSLFATSSISFWSWGENIYIDLAEKNGNTEVAFCSACIFGLVSWGRNEKNFELLLETFEKSLVI